MRRLRQLEEENAKLKRLVADLSLEGDAAGCRQPKNLRPDRRRQLVDAVRSTWSVSIRRACGVLRAERSSYHYRGRRADQADLKKRMREIAESRVRYGYRRIHVLLRREGWNVNAKRIYRLYKQMGRQLRHKPPKRRVKAKLREGRCAASCSNDVWAMDSSMTNSPRDPSCVS